MNLSAPSRGSPTLSSCTIIKPTPSTIDLLIKNSLLKEEKMTLDRVNDEMMIMGLMDEMKMKKWFAREIFFREVGRGWQSQHGHLELKFLLHDWCRGCVIFRRKAARKICAEKLKLPHFEKNVLRPERKNLHKK
jgi:hypothetical protein